MEYFVVTISDVLVNSIQQTDALPDKILEKVTFNALKFDFKYRTVNADGFAVQSEEYGYDCRTQKAF